VFGSTTSDLEYLCGAVAQEASHVWGLDHELNKDDPMTYLDLGSLKRFQNASAQCHDAQLNPSQCQCGGSTQNSYQYLLQTFGASNLPPATLTIATPIDGQWVKPGFPVRAQLTSQIEGSNGGSLSIDGAQVMTSSATAPLAFNAPTTLGGGEHTISVQGSDGSGSHRDGECQGQGHRGVQRRDAVRERDELHRRLLRARRRGRRRPRRDVHLERHLHHRPVRLCRRPAALHGRMHRGKRLPVGLRVHRR